MKDVVQAVPALQKLFEQDFPIKTSFAIGRLIRELNSELETYNQERSKLIYKYANKEENADGTFSFNEENAALFQKEVMELLETEIEINAEYISFELIENATITPNEAISLECFVK